MVLTLREHMILFFSLQDHRWSERGFLCHTLRARHPQRPLPRAPLAHTNASSSVALCA